MTKWELLDRILSNGCSVSPLFSVPGVTNTMFRIDWLHVCDQGVTADFLANLFVLVMDKLPGANKKARCLELWRRVQEFYEEHQVADRLQTLVLSMIQQVRKAPKLRCSAAQRRALVPFGVKISELLADDNAVELSAKQAMKHLNQCYRALSTSSIFDTYVLQENSVKFALLYTALEASADGTRSWRVKPKLHLFMHLCSDGSKPALYWNYRDEDWGGSVAKMSRRRGGLLSAKAFSENLLQRFRMHQPVLRMHQR